MKKLLSILFFTLSIPYLSVAEPYNDCIIKNMKNVNERYAAVHIQKACLEKTTPKKCRIFLAHNKDNYDVYLKKKKYLSDEEVMYDNTHFLPGCLEKCKNASFYSRTFGECATD